MFSLFRLLLAAGLVLVAQPGAGRATFDGYAAAGEGLPRLLRDTGLHAAGPGRRVRDGIAGFTPQYPLWSDGADKRRWLYLPPGASIDASQPDAWEFPRGTKLWKEFAFQGRPVETRYIERGRDGQWRFGAYVWNEEGTEAVLAPARGLAALLVPTAPQGRYAIPSRTDCLACHGSTTVPVLGFTALQLAGDLRALAASGWLRGLPRELTQSPPRIPAEDPVERAALGYLHGNCAHCHNTTASRVPLALTLAQRAGDAATALAEVRRSTIAAPGRYRPADADGAALVVAPGKPGDSLLALRMQSRHKQVQMPPLGTSVPDAQGLDLVHRWISSIPPSHPKETLP